MLLRLFTDRDLDILGCLSLTSSSMGCSVEYFIGLVFFPLIASFSRESSSNAWVRINDLSWQFMLTLPFSFKWMFTGPGGDLWVYLEGLAMAENVQEYVKSNPFGQRPIRETNPSWGYYRKVIEAVKSKRNDRPSSSARERTAYRNRTMQEENDRWFSFILMHAVCILVTLVMIKMLLFWVGEVVLKYIYVYKHMLLQGGTPYTHYSVFIFFLFALFMGFCFQSMSFLYN